MSNIYKKSMEQMKFSEEFNKNTIMKMSAVKNRQSNSETKVLRTVSVAAVLVIVAIGSVFWIQHTVNQNHSALPLVENTNNPLIVVESPVYTVAPTESIVLLSTKDKIIEQQEYGVVSLCVRRTENIQTIAKSLGVTDSRDLTLDCYEDDQYIYFFSEDGAVAGVMASYLIDNPSEYDPAINKNWVRLSEDEAVALARSAVLKYCDNYTEDTSERFTVKVWGEKSDVPHYPDWRITFTEHTASGIQRNTITVNIDMLGNVATVFFGLRSDVSDEELEKSEYISEETAISLALDQLKIEGYEVGFEHYTVTANMVEVEGSVSWVLAFELMKNADGEYIKPLPWKRAYWAVLNASTGEWIRTSVSR